MRDQLYSNLKRPRVLDMVERDRDRKAVKRDAYAEVDERDGRRCRCCGRRGNPNAIGVLGRIHRCHIHDAGTRGGMRADNLVSLCWICAALETAKQLFFEGTDAHDMSLTFGVMDVAVVEIFGDRPLPPHVHIVLKAPRQRYGE